MILAKLDDSGDLNRATKRQARYAYCGATVPTLIAKHFNENIGGAVDHFRMCSKFGGCMYVTCHGADANDAQVVRQLRAKLREQGKPGKSCRFFCVLDADFRADLAHGERCAVLECDLP